MKKKYIGIMVIMLFMIHVIPVTAVYMQSPSEPIDQSPTKPLMEGPVEAKYGEICNYTAVSEDPQGDPITYVIEFSDAPRSVNEQGPELSGVKIEFSHAWSDFYQEKNPYKVRVKAVDDQGHESEWARFITHITDDESKGKHIENLELFQLIEMLFNRLYKLNR